MRTVAPRNFRDRIGLEFDVISTGAAVLPERHVQRYFQTIGMIVKEQPIPPVILRIRALLEGALAGWFICPFMTAAGQLHEFESHPS